MTKRLSTEDWFAMTAAANASSRHRGSLDYWIPVALADNPALTPGQAGRQAERLRSQYYADMGRRSAASRKAAATARAAAAAAE